MLHFFFFTKFFLLCGNFGIKKLSIRGATQKAIQYGLKTLDKILQEETNNTANKQIAPRRIENVSDSNCP